MTIDKSKRILIDRYMDTYVICGGYNYDTRITITREDYEAFQVAIDTMRKYQKIEEMVSNYGFDTSWLCLKKIREVLEDE